MRGETIAGVVKEIRLMDLGVSDIGDWCRDCPKNSPISIIVISFYK
jgi:hypothetical protein